MTRDLVDHCVAFCRALRTDGVPVTPAETVLATRVLELVDVTDREELRNGLRAVLTMSRDQQRAFDLAFDAFWRAPGDEGPRRPPSPARSTRAPNARGPGVVSLDR